MGLTGPIILHKIKWRALGSGRAAMTSWNLPVTVILLLLEIAVASASSVVDHAPSGGGGGGGRRVLLSFKETPQGSNHTFECSPSGPCVPCQYSEKNDEKYRCSETGYRIPLKCVEIKDVKNENEEKKTQDRRSTAEIFHQNKNPSELSSNTTSKKYRTLLGSTSTSESGSQAYITYRSCIQQVSEEKLSVIGFEGIVFCLLLVSGSAVYFRKKRTAIMSGVATGRTQTNSRF